MTLRVDALFRGGFGDAVGIEGADLDVFAAWAASLLRRWPLGARIEVHRVYEDA